MIRSNIKIEFLTADKRDLKFQKRITDDMGFKLHLVSEERIRFIEKMALKMLYIWVTGFLMLRYLKKQNTE